MRLKFPGKTFLLGEYAVLKRGPAILLGHGPYFEADLVGGGATRNPFHPESPAGRWLARFPFAGSIDFSDPHRGAGGFGGSGAEFLAAWYSRREIPRSMAARVKAAQEAWQDSREFPGSGADILTQAYGVNADDAFLLHLDFGSAIPDIEPLDRRLGLNLSLFHTGRKLPTHEALSQLPPLPQEELRDLVIEAAEALRGRNAKWFADAMQTYGETLAKAGLLASHSREALASLPPTGVRAAKGCGAMGADVLAVLHTGANLGPWASANSLAEVARLPV